MILVKAGGPVSEQDLESEIPGEISKQLRAAGVCGWVCDTFTAPLEFRHMLLVNQPAVWKSMYAERPLDEKMMKEAQSMKDVKGLLDGKNHYMFVRSQYGKREVSVSSTPYNGQERAKTLFFGADAAEKTRLQREVEVADKAFKEAQEQQKVFAFLCVCVCFFLLCISFVRLLLLLCRSCWSRSERSISERLL